MRRRHPSAGPGGLGFTGGSEELQIIFGQVGHLWVGGGRPAGSAVDDGGRYRRCGGR